MLKNIRWGTVAGMAVAVAVMTFLLVQFDRWLIS